MGMEDRKPQYKQRYCRQENSRTVLEIHIKYWAEINLEGSYAHYYTTNAVHELK